MNYNIPPHYKSKLDVWETEQGIKFIKETFQTELAGELKLRRITAPLFVPVGTGLNDTLNGVEQPVRFDVSDIGVQVEIVQSLAKWKRYSLWKHHIHPGMGIYTDMNALRPDETLDAIHSVYVDQWDWESVIEPQQRTVDTLYAAVKKIYQALRRTEFLLSERFPALQPFLPAHIHICTAEDILQQYPQASAKEREHLVAKEYGAVFIRGIGGVLSNGQPHDGRSPDYDDWSTPTPDGTFGLNGDLIVWNPVLQDSFELSSMGIRVDPQALLRQLELRHAQDRSTLLFHSLLLEGKLPQTMGGGIGQSRLCMLLMQKCHIGEVQAGVWDKDTVTRCAQQGVFLM